MLLTPLTNTHALKNLIQQPKMHTESFVKTLEIEGRKYDLQFFGMVTEYSNGTKLLQCSVTVENICSTIPRIRVNFTKAVTSEELKTITAKKQSPIVLSSYEGPLQEYTWDGNIYFVKAPGNYTLFVKYDHNNNYWRYYPSEWNRPWHIQIGEYGNEKLHTHMANGDLYLWKTDQISDEELFKKYLIEPGTHEPTLTPLGAAILGGLAGGCVGGIGSILAGSSNPLILLASVVAGILGAIFNWLLQQLAVPKSQWIENVVEAEEHEGVGDGFFWSWNFHTKYEDAWIYDPEMPYIGSGLDPRILQQYSEYLSLYHRISVGVYQVREFYRTWGANRDASPETYNIELWLDLQNIPAGIFAQYGSIYK